MNTFKLKTQKMDTSVHKKMYHAGKFWLYAGIALLGLTGVGMSQSTVQAATVTTNTAVPVSVSGATTTTSAAANTELSTSSVATSAASSASSSVTTSAATNAQSSTSSSVATSAATNVSGATAVSASATKSSAPSSAISSVAASTASVNATHSTGSADGSVAEGASTAMDSAAIGAQVTQPNNLVASVVATTSVDGISTTSDVTSSSATMQKTSATTLLGILPKGTTLAETATTITYALPEDADLSKAKAAAQMANLDKTVTFTQVGADSATQLNGGDAISLANNKQIATTTSQESSEIFAAGGNASIGADGIITLTKSGVANTSGTAIFNNNLDMSQTWTLQGSFIWGDTWGKGQYGWNAGAGAGLIISDAKVSALDDGGAGAAFGIGGIGNSIVAAIDARTDAKATTATAKNGVNYTVAADTPVAQGANNPGTVNAQGQLDLNSSGWSLGGAPKNVAINGAQSVIKFLTTNGDGTVVTNGGDSTLEKAYSPGSARDHATAIGATQASDLPDYFTATWTPDAIQTVDNRVDGALTVVFSGNTTDYPGGFTISTHYSSSEYASVGLVGSNDTSTSKGIRATITSMTGSIKAVTATINYAGLPSDLSIASSKITGKAGDTVSVNGSADNNYVAPVIAGYHVASITGLTNNTITADGPNAITVTYAADVQQATIMDGTTVLETVTGVRDAAITFTATDATLTKTGKVFTVTAPDGTTYQTLAAALKGQTYDHTANGTATTDATTQNFTVTYYDTTTAPYSNEPGIADDVKALTDLTSQDSIADPSASQDSIADPSAIQVAVDKLAKDIQTAKTDRKTATDGAAAVEAKVTTENATVPEVAAALKTLKDTVTAAGTDSKTDLTADIETATTALQTAIDNAGTAKTNAATAITAASPVTNEPTVQTAIKTLTDLTSNPSSSTAAIDQAITDLNNVVATAKTIRDTAVQVAQAQIDKIPSNVANDLIVQTATTTLQTALTNAGNNEGTTANITVATNSLHQAIITAQSQKTSTSVTPADYYDNTTFTRQWADGAMTKVNIMKNGDYRVVTTATDGTITKAQVAQGNGVAGTLAFTTANGQINVVNTTNNGNVIETLTVATADVTDATYNKQVTTQDNVGDTTVVTTDDTEQVTNIDQTWADGTKTQVQIQHMLDDGVSVRVYVGATYQTATDLTTTNNQLALGDQTLSLTNGQLVLTQVKSSDNDTETQLTGVTTIKGNVDYSGEKQIAAPNGGSTTISTDGTGAITQISKTWQDGSTTVVTPAADGIPIITSDTTNSEAKVTTNGANEITIIRADNDQKTTETGTITQTPAATTGKASTIQVSQTVTTASGDTNSSTWQSQPTSTTSTPQKTYTKTQVGDAVSVDPSKSTVTITPVDLSGNPLAGVAPITVHGVAGYEVQAPEVPGYKAVTSTVKATNGENKVVYVPTSDGHKLDDGIQVKTQTGHAVSIDPSQSTVTITPVDLSGNPLAGVAPMTVHGVAGYEVQTPEVPGYKAVTSTVKATNGENKVVYVPTSDGHKLDDGVQVKTQTGHAVSVDPSKSTVTITPVDLSGNPLAGVAPITVHGVAGYEVQTPEVPGYKAVTSMIKATNGDNKVVYVPTSDGHKLDDGVQVKTQTGHAVGVTAQDYYDHTTFTQKWADGSTATVKIGKQSQLTVTTTAVDGTTKTVTLPNGQGTIGDIVVSTTGQTVNLTKTDGNTVETVTVTSDGTQVYRKTVTEKMTNGTKATTTDADGNVIQIVITADNGTTITTKLSADGGYQIVRQPAKGKAQNHVIASGQSVQLPEITLTATDSGLIIMPVSAKAPQQVTQEQTQLPQTNETPTSLWSILGLTLLGGLGLFGKKRNEEK